jgi:ectoine hydroxylase-related dioxygenase (phytanoyl-CoA dioxygenase family)
MEHLKQPHTSLWFAHKKIPPEGARPLPTPTRDAAALKADLDVHGYCIIAQTLSASELRELRIRVEEQLNAEVPMDHPTGRRSLTNLLNKGAIFERVILNDLVNPTVEHLLGEGYLLSALTAIQSVPNSKAQGLHFDQARMGMFLPAPLVANAVYMLDDFTNENGGTRVIPGSHVWAAEEIERNFTPSLSALDTNPEGTIAVQGAAGSCMVFEGRLLHGTGKNVTLNQKRTGVFAYYCRGWVRQLENPFLSISDDIMQNLSVPVRERLGYKAWNAFGGYQGPGFPPPMDVVRPTGQIRELK